VADSLPVGQSRSGSDAGSTTAPTGIKKDRQKPIAIR
jgi:hypothetical protein